MNIDIPTSLSYRVIHSKRLPIPSASFHRMHSLLDVTPAHISRKDVRCRTEGTMKTDMGTNTDEQPQYPLNYSVVREIMSGLGRRDLDSPIDLRLSVNTGSVMITTVDLQRLTYERYHGSVAASGRVSTRNKLTSETRLLYMTIRNRVIYLCLVQGLATEEQLYETFEQFTRHLRQYDYMLSSMCLRCAMECNQPLVWDGLNNQLWNLDGKMLRLFHSRHCQHRKYDPPARLKSYSKAKHFNAPPKLVLEDKLYQVMDFIRPAESRDPNRVNEIVVLKTAQLRPKSCVNRIKRRV